MSRTRRQAAVKAREAFRGVALGAFNRSLPDDVLPGWEVEIALATSPASGTPGVRAPLQAIHPVKSVIRRALTYKLAMQNADAADKHAVRAAMSS
jgi:hypothetical protein